LLQSANQIGGFFARLEASRKYLFASMVVLGKANDSIITGVIFGRGDSAQALIDCAPDWESYATAPLDFSKAEDKKFFEDSLTWDLQVGDKAFADGKIFK
jgi:elongation factor 1-gamma